MCDKLGEAHEEGIASYGSDNDMRLTGLHETQSIDTFSYGVVIEELVLEFRFIQLNMTGMDTLKIEDLLQMRILIKFLAHIVGTLT